MVYLWVFTYQIGRVTKVFTPFVNGSAALLVIAIATFAAPSSTAQVAISVTDTSGWTAWQRTDGLLMTDPRGDQQTGQGQDDFVGDLTFAGFQQKAGTIGGADHVVFRTRMDKYDARGFGGNWELGMDLDGNGSVDLVMKLSDKNGQTLTFATPGIGANNSPATTSWGSFVGSIALTSSTYNYQQATDGSAFGGTADAFVTFGISFANLQNAIRTYAGPAFSNFVVNYTTRIAFIAFTSTQGNAINQDLYGTSGNTTSTTTFASLGAATGPMDAYGVVPEPATYAQLGALLLAGGFVAWRRRRARAVPAGGVSRSVVPCE